jgi:hypothetical protein
VCVTADSKFLIFRIWILHVILPIFLSSRLKKKKGKEKPEVQRLVSLWQRWNLTQGFWSAVIYSLLLVPKAWELTTPQDDRV